MADLNLNLNGGTELDLNGGQERQERTGTTTRADTRNSKQSQQLVHFYPRPVHQYFDRCPFELHWKVPGSICGRASAAIVEGPGFNSRPRHHSVSKVVSTPHTSSPKQVYGYCGNFARNGTPIQPVSEAPLDLRTPKTVGPKGDFSSQLSLIKNRTQNCRQF